MVNVLGFAASGSLLQIFNIAAAMWKQATGDTSIPGDAGILTSVFYLENTFCFDALYEARRRLLFSDLYLQLGIVMPTW